jgi:uroporphyrinogen-III decarboxylase
MPWDLLEGADWARVNRSCAATDRFVLGVSETRPFEVMQLLRGTTQLFLDLVYQPEELFRLRDRLHEFMLRHITLWAQTDVDGIVLFDDWGSQHAMLISPKLWRAFFKPMYRDYFQLIHGAGKYVFFHSDGYIRPILDDLVEIGVDALNSQLFCMDIEEVGRTFRGRLTFWGEIDRQIILPLARGEWVRQAVRRVRRALDDGRGGVIAQCEFCHDVPKENVMAIFEAWQEPR